MLCPIKIPQKILPTNQNYNLFYYYRDRELQIARIEEERHKVREKELGKNYLLETYLNGLHEAEDRDVTTGKSM